MPSHLHSFYSIMAYCKISVVAYMQEFDEVSYE
ncbi:MAG: hypothetical protein BMS9Abin31_0132 [Gammaproteobacteria bacterium]|nr:MAG: hypothetical protein BMS9Abin31_0132 [Gammaproteobacteria bacterium]